MNKKLNFSEILSLWTQDNIISKNLLVTFYKFAVILLLIFISGCVPSNLESPSDDLGKTFPVNLITIVQLPDKQTSQQEQVAYCSYDQLVSQSISSWNIIVRSLEDSNESKVDGRLEGLSLAANADLGCFGSPDATGARVYGLNWSPDGEQLIFNANNNLIMKAAINDAGETISISRLLNPPKYTFYDFAHAGVWSPDGNLIAFISSFQQGQPEQGAPLFSDSVFIVSEDGSNPEYFEQEQRLPGVLSDPVWSHDSKYLAYVLPIPENGIGIIDISSKRVTRISSENISQIPEGTDETHGILPVKSIAWFPGNELILFLTNGDSAPQDILWAVKSDGSNPIRLFEDNIQEIDLSPDGQKLAFIVENQSEFSIQLLEINETVTVSTLIDTAEWNLVDDANAQIRDLDWSPDGSRLIFAASPEGNFDLFYWDFNAKDLKQVTDTANSDEIAPRWRPYR